jgi:hypothetical protein
MVGLRLFLDFECCVCKLCLRFPLMTSLLRNRVRVPCFCFQSKDKLEADRSLPRAKGLAASFLITSVNAPDPWPLGVD